MRKTVLAALVFGLLLTIGLTRSAAAQAGQKERTVDAKSIKGAQGPDQNVKQGETANMKGAKGMRLAPPSKGGPTPKGAAGTIHVDNRTNLYVKIYVDGDFRGTVEPWGDLYVLNLCGSTTLYARADYTDGTYDYWGPTSDNFCSTTWTLRG
jgi:hypothetical protein